MLTGKRNDSTQAPSDEPTAAPQPLSKAARDRLAAELAYHEESAAALERNGNRNTYHHERAAAIRAELPPSEVNDGKLD